MAYDYYSPVGGMSLAFTALKDSEQRAEIWTKQPPISAASVAKAVEALTLNAIYDIRYFSLMEKTWVRIAPEPPSSAKKKKVSSLSCRKDD